MWKSENVSFLFNGSYSISSTQCLHLRVTSTFLPCFWWIRNLFVNITCYLGALFGHRSIAMLRHTVVCYPFMLVSRSLDQDLTLEGPPGRGYKGTYSLSLVSALFVNYSVPGDQTLPPAQRICWIKAKDTHSLVTLDKNLTRNLDHPQSSFMLSDSI